ncbi:alpha/beta fold hydrolase [Nocardia sp. NPDC004123]
MNTESFQTPLGPVAYSTAGSGEGTIVFVHGWTCHRAHWDEVMAELASRYSLISIDLPGHGGSAATGGPYDIARYASEVAAIAATAKGSVSLVGHSMGAPICVEAAGLLPDRITRVIALDALVHRGVYPRQRKWVLLLYRLGLRWLYSSVTRTIIDASFVEPYDQDLRTRITADMRAVPPRVGRAALNSLLEWDRDAAIERTTVPITILPAEGMYDPADGESLATRCEIDRRLPGGHFSFMEIPKETARLIAETLDTRSPQSSAC